MDNSFFGTAFLSCNELRDAIKRGFDTWAINHKKIYFRDVSDQCADVTSYDYCPRLSSDRPTTTSSRRSATSRPT